MGPVDPPDSHQVLICTARRHVMVVWWAALGLLVATWNPVRTRLTARTPADAWPDEPLPPDPADPYWDRWANG